MSEDAVADAGPGGRPAQSRSIERRARVLAAAVQVLLGSGAAGVTHRRVAEEAESSLGAIRYYFRTRIDLLAACLEEIERVRDAEAVRVLEQAGDCTSPTADETATLAMRVFYGPDLQDAAVAGMVWSITDCAREGTRLSRQLARHRQAASRQVHLLLADSGYPDLSPSLAPTILDGSVITSAVESRSELAALAAAELAAVLRAIRPQAGGAGTVEE